MSTSKPVPRARFSLYLWENVLSDYTHGCAFAIARSKEEAIELCVKSRDGHYAEEELKSTEVRVLPLNKPFGFTRDGGA